MANKSKIILVSLVVTLAGLFALYFLQQWLLLELPLRQAIGQNRHVTIQQMKMVPDEVKIQLRPERGFDLLDDYPALYRKTKEILGDRTFQLAVIDHQTPKLKQAWEEMEFGVSEGIAQEKYGLVKRSVEQAAKQYQIKAGVQMEDEFVLISLRDETGTLYRVLPLRQEVTEDG
jgi:hypothetical protein